ncbi:transposable element Tc1 transposase [Trichonephila clavipes]|uniref:Transposable element Tc1 transposase n=1 Tax=Trichonephila clavipes TaxID=2585209 RepID=A0A8X6V284_TRICX|nr:transposable element Tc1 transposase [Trichonephila clavipes]
MTNRLKRIAFEKDHIHKPLEFWRTVIFSDEGKFCIFGIKGCKLIWRKPCTALQKEHLVPTVKHGGGGVMVWGCMESNNVGSWSILSRSSKEVHSSIKQTIRFILTLGARYNTGLRTCPTGDELCFYTLRNIREITSMHSKE